MGTYIYGKTEAGFTYKVTLNTVNPSPITVSGSSFTVTKPAWTAKGIAYNLYYFRFASDQQTQLQLYFSGSPVASFPNQNTNTVDASQANDPPTTLASTTSGEINTSAIFNSSNATTKTVTLTVPLGRMAFYNKAYGTWEVYPEAPSGWDKVMTCSVTLDAPPTFDSTQVYFDTPYVYAGYTTASVDVSNISAKYGGDISSVAFTVGSQTVTGSGNGTLSIALTAGGTFTPTVKVTDSRGQATTKALNTITVNAYVDPTVSFTAERTDNLGVPNDEGESAVITATFNYTDVVASLTTPTIVVTDQDNTVVTPTITWYANRELTTVISNWSSVASGATVYALLNNANHDLFNTQKSYQIALTPNDTEGSGTAITQILGSAFYTVDFLAGGHGIAFGQACTDEGFFCNMDANFMQDVFLALDTTSASGTDHDLYVAITALGWQSEVIV